MNQEVVVRQEAFDDLQLSIIEQEGEEWFSAEDIGKALGMAEPRKTIVNLFNRNRDEFEGLYRVINLMTWMKSQRKLPRRLTMFNPQGAYLLAILARTPKSKALRRWLAKFMTQDIHRLKDHVMELEKRHQNDRAKIGRLVKKLKAHTSELKIARTFVASAISLPSPEPKPLLPLTKDDMILMNYLELKKLYEFSYEHGLTETHGMEVFSPGYLVRVIDRDAAVPKLKLEMNLPVTISGYNLVGLSS
jgi:prophage antirepressor-like protein